jgi:hypothetical protein
MHYRHQGHELTDSIQFSLRATQGLQGITPSPLLLDSHSFVNFSPQPQESASAQMAPYMMRMMKDSGTASLPMLVSTAHGPHTKNPIDIKIWRTA